MGGGRLLEMLNENNKSVQFGIVENGKKVKERKANKFPAATKRIIKRIMTPTEASAICLADTKNFLHAIIDKINTQVGNTK